MPLTAQDPNHLDPSYQEPNHQDSSKLSAERQMANSLKLKKIPSPFHNERPNQTIVDLLVIHNISLPPGQFGTGKVEEFFTGKLNSEEHPFFEEIKDLQVSAHYFIDRTGSVIEFVDPDQRAWHAGVSSWHGRENCNDFSIGIELEGTDSQPYSDAQYFSLTQLVELLMTRYPAISAERIVGHCDIAPTRKTDPGESFDWQRFRELLSCP